MSAPLKQLAKLEFEDVTIPSVSGNDMQKPWHELGVGTAALDKPKFEEQHSALNSPLSVLSSQLSLLHACGGFVLTLVVSFLYD